jgi:hypothetical protein
MPEPSQSSEQLQNINPDAEKIRLRRDHLRRIGDLAVKDLDPNEDEALVDRIREMAILKEIREFSQTELLHNATQTAERSLIKIFPEQLAMIRQLLIDFSNDGIVLSPLFLETIHTDADVDHAVISSAINQLRHEGLLSHTASGYVKAPTGDDHQAWLQATVTGPINILRSNN